MTYQTVDECIALMRKKQPFKHRHVFGDLNEGDVIHPPTYAVYSYDKDLPLYVYDYETCQWFGLDATQDEWPASVIKHLRKYKPYSVAHWVSYLYLRTIAVKGYVTATSEAVSIGADV